MPTKLTSVVKRDGQICEFNKSKIREAVEKAFIAVDGSLTDEGAVISNKIAHSIEDQVKLSDDPFSVEHIQDIVEDELMTSSRKDVARAYITYRDKRSRARARNSKFRNAIREKLSASNVVNQNANLDERSFGGRKGEADSVLLKEMALDEGMSAQSRLNHENNEIYEHDLDSWYIGMHNCLTIPFSRLLKEGVDTRQTDIRPAGSINTAMQLVAVLFQIQSLQQFGGVSAGSIDMSMVPYVRKSFFKHYKTGLKYLLTEQEYSQLKENLS